MSDKKYSKNNLNQVIFQIRYSPLLELYTDEEKAAAEFQKVVVDEFPELKFQQENKISVKINDEGKPIETSTDNKFLTWVFFNQDKDKITKQIKLNGKELILSYSGDFYSSFKDFFKDIELVLNGLNKYCVPKIKFIGLRYVNQIKINKSFYSKNFVNPNLYKIKDEFNEEEFIQSLTKTELKIGDYLLIFQFGEFNPEYPSTSSKKEFILDYDCILNDDEIFSNIQNNLNKMHEIIHNRFEKDIGDNLREAMK